jgi:crotonobetainyl-CoA:carnitine CoA-transferase CaiB-like acyl-CoA transferase
MTPPLRDIRVLEVGSFFAGPFCGTQLADLGADVIKVEHPGNGDHGRHFGPLLEGESSHFVRLNRNKRSLAIDLKSDDGRAVFRRLAGAVDIVVENLRPGTMRELLLDYQTVLAKENPGLIYIAVSGWGQDGPLSAQPGQDIMAQARSGLMSITGLPDGEPVKVGVPICDLTCALYATIAALAALQSRNATGRGQFIDVSLFESAVSLSIWEAGLFFATGQIPRALGSAHQNAAPYQAVRSADGSFTVGAVTRRNWIALCEALGLTALLDDSRFQDETTRLRNRTALIAIIEAVTRTRPTREWLAVLEGAGVPCAPIQNYGDVYSDPHLLARDYFWDADHPTIGPVRQLGSPMRFSETPVRRGKAGPRLGEHTAAVLAELGFTDAETGDLLERGVVRGLAPQKAVP